MNVENARQHLDQDERLLKAVREKLSHQLRRLKESLRREASFDVIFVHTSCFVLCRQRKKS